MGMTPDEAHFGSFTKEQCVEFLQLNGVEA